VVFNNYKFLCSLYSTQNLCIRHSRSIQHKAVVEFKILQQWCTYLSNSNKKYICTSYVLKDWMTCLLLYSKTFIKSILFKVVEERINSFVRVRNY